MCICLTLKELKVIQQINGNPYTSAQEDMRVEAIVTDLNKHLIASLTRAFEDRRDGHLRIDLSFVRDSVFQAYYLGRDK
jgi:hypothetical protein